MAVRTYKPTSPGRRDMMVADFSPLTRSKPILLVPTRKHKTIVLAKIRIRLLEQRTRVLCHN